MPVKDRMMVCNGTVQGNRIELDAPLPLANGTRVRMEVSPETPTRRGSPRALLRLAGTLTNEEADAILHVVQECRRVDDGLWSNGA